MRLRYNLEWLDSGQPRRDLEAGRYLLGRGGRSDLIFDAPGVSREHAELVVCADRGVLLRDLGSTNGTRVDGERIVEGAFGGDIDLVLGSVSLRLREHRPGLDELAVVLGGKDFAAGAAAAMPAAAASPTAVSELIRELRTACSTCRPAPAAWPADALTALLQRWVAQLGIERLQWRHGSSVVALAGACDEAELQLYLDESGWRLLGDPLPPAQARDLAEVAAELTRWALPSVPDSGLVQGVPPLRDWPGLPSAAAAMRAVLEPLARAAPSTISVLLLGETGVGKELVAQWLHRSSPRANATLLAINCAALPRDLLEAELFGVERGAATGVEARPGLFERAHGGTLFLDEIGDTTPETQVRLLRVLETGELSRVGGRASIRVDVRLLCATHRELGQEVEAGRFRADLYHRIAGYCARIPPLRERGEDIAPLAIHFFQQALRRSGRSSPGITAAALLALQRWHWPGNVRELRQAIEHALVVLHDGEALDRVHLPETLRGSAPTRAELRLDYQLAQAERDALVTALALAGGQMERAWNLLGIGKTSFYKKLREHGLGRTAAEDAG